VFWGGIQAGYNDPNANITLENYIQQKIAGVRGCTANISHMIEKDLSLTYQHLPDSLNGKIYLKQLWLGKLSFRAKEY